MMASETESYRKLIDYIYLLRVMKFSKSSLIKLFQKPNMGISRLKQANKEKLQKYLLYNKKSNLDDFKKMSDLYDFNFKSPEYLKIESQIKSCLTQDIKIFTPFDKSSPKLFETLKPVYKDLIFVKGHIFDKDLKSYSICGTRRPTQDAAAKTNRIAELMAKNNFTLINGFAKGIDIEAFLGARKQDGRYIGVLASGVESVYPPENKKYSSIVAKNGALISQALIWNRVNKTSLQLRNRLSAQLSLGSIFIEGNYKSGTKWQYKFAKEAGRLIFYLEPKDWSHENTHVLKLIKDGGGIEIKNDLSNMNLIAESLEKEFFKRKEVLSNS